MSRIYILEDNEIDRRLYKSLLGTSYDLKFDDKIEGFLKRVASFQPDLVLLDLSLPDGDGLPACGLLSNDPDLSQIPVFIVTSRTDPETKLMGLGLGANDFIVKPFNEKELQLKIQNKLKRDSAIKKSSGKITKFGFEVNLDEQRAFVDEKGQKTVLSLTSTEFKLLTYFLKNENKVISRDQLLEHVWGQDVHVSDRTVDSHVSSLRKKCGSQAKRFQSVYGEGYRFNTSSKLSA
jgi:two-component system alkaline phosphatase synthesis response regulator PhoP